MDGKGCDLRQMSERNIVQTTFDAFGKSLGGVKRSGSWYTTGADAVVVMDLQKSQYSVRYFINLGIWFLGVGASDWPKVPNCHVETRLTRITANAEEKDYVDRLLDMEFPLADEERNQKLLARFSRIEPVLVASLTLDGLINGAGRELLDASLVSRDGQTYLDANAPGWRTKVP